MAVVIMAIMKMMIALVVVVVVMVVIFKTVSFPFDIMNCVTSPAKCYREYLQILKQNSSLSYLWGKTVISDSSKRYLWRHGEKAYFDMRMFNPVAESHFNTSLQFAHLIEGNEMRRQH